MAADRSAGAGSAGTVFDIGYRRYDGAREGRAHSRRAIFRDGIRIALGFGRGGRPKILPWFFITVLASIGLVMAIVAGAAERLGGEGAAERAGLPSHGDFYSIAAILLFVFAAVIAPELLCRDRREGTITLYFVRPITSTDYVGSRWAACLAVMTAAAWLPQVILFVGLSMGDPTPMGYLGENWLDVPRFMAAGLAMAAYVTSLAMLTSSFTTRRAYATVFLVGVFAITAPFTMGLAEEIGGRAGQWISLFNLANIPIYLNDVIFGEVSELTEDAPARAFPFLGLLAWYLLWTAGSAAALWWRYRRLAR